jgi:hypothetical protein
VEQAVFCHKCGERLAVAPSDSFTEAQTGDPAASLAQPSLTRSAEETPEKELWQGGYSSKAMFDAWALCGLLTVCLMVIGIFTVRSLTGWLILLGLASLPWIYSVAVYFHRHWSVRYCLTTQRFIHERGILRRVNDRIEVLDMNDITFQQRLTERLWGTGTIIISSKDQTHPRLILPGIEDVASVAAIIDNTRLAERRRRGLHVEQI